MIRYLLDVNLLIALSWPTHVDHDIAQSWFRRKGRSGWASCPLNQLGFVRISSNPKFVDGAVSPQEAIALLHSVSILRNHQFWPDGLNLVESELIPFCHLVGHRQLTDAYLIGLARKNKGKVASLDPGMRSLLPDPHEQRKYLEIIE
jgi:toxin-antitoxin system PIN domain toxin